MPTVAQQTHMHVGVDYYPEHWPRARWETDAKLMKKAGFNTVRLAEFAWVKMEPEEGKYDFEWLDDALAVLGKQGISAILGTPTAVMPAWMAHKYPETLLTNKGGDRAVWGVRKNNCFTSGAYRLLSDRITLAMAEHYRDNKSVIGWQTDNEFHGGGQACYCHTCRAEFQEWLRKKYGDIASLNQQWGAHFWGHLYREWSEIQLPVDTSGHNPGACLDWHRFASWTNVRFQADQVRILRQHCPKHFITHNLMGLFKELDSFDLAKDLDFASWDNYPVWGDQPELSHSSALAADLIRGLKKKNFWIMEQTAGPCGWGTFARNPRPGEIRTVSYQQLAHGADGQIWFRWRTCTAGREQYWHGLLGHDGKALRRYDEAAQVAKEYHRLWPLLEGTTVKSDVAFIYDYDSLWVTMFQKSFNGNDYQASLLRWYKALSRAGVNADVVSSGADLSSYRLVFAPNLHVLPDALATRLLAYVAAGGVLLCDCRTGVKTESNLCWDRTLPGALAPVLGIEIEEYGALDNNQEFSIEGESELPGSFNIHQYVDYVTPKSAQALARHTAWFLESFAAVTRNAYKKGSGWYVGVISKDDAFYAAVTEKLLADAGIKPVVRPPPEVEVSIRQGKNSKLLFVINHSENKKTVKVPKAKLELLSGVMTTDTLELDRFGVAVIQLR
ncbi:MAG: beta-galactosidase [Polyangiaceae bacterium]|nr:beta-galactosidase [Polyangiaceae bacterium]